MYIVDDAANRSKLHPRNSEDEDVKVLTEATGATGSSGLEVLLGRYSFHPLYIVVPWLDKENGCKEMLTVAAVIPSGLGTEDVTVELNERGNSMKIGCTWPAPLVTPDLLCEYFIKDRNNKNYHPEVNSLESVVNSSSWTVRDYDETKSIRYANSFEDFLKLPLVGFLIADVYGWEAGNSNIANRTLATIAIIFMVPSIMMISYVLYYTKPFFIC